MYCGYCFTIAYVVKILSDIKGLFFGVEITEDKPTGNFGPALLYAVLTENIFPFSLTSFFVIASKLLSYTLCSMVCS